MSVQPDTFSPDVATRSHETDFNTAFGASPSNRGKNRFVLSIVAQENKKCTIDVNFMRFYSFLTGQICTFAPE